MSGSQSGEGRAMAMRQLPDAQLFLEAFLLWMPYWPDYWA